MTPSMGVILISFLSTLSLRRATSQQPLGTTRTACFYPRSPCGERLVDALILANAMLFLSTLSLRRATASSHGERQGQRVSIHALLAESDPGKIRILDDIFRFLSTLSLRRATK